MVRIYSLGFKIEGFTGCIGNVDCVLELKIFGSRVEATNSNFDAEPVIVRNPKP